MRKIVHGGDIYSKSHIHNLLDLSANINPLGMPDKVKKAIIDNINNYEAYPDPLCRDLRKALSNYHNINEDFIVCGNGAADVIFRLVLALKPKKALILAPTFAEYEEALSLSNTEVSYYDLKEENNFEIQEDVLQSINSDLDIFFMCNPNNPTGIALEKDKVLKIAEKCKDNNVLLVLDECFSDFLINEEEYSFVPYLKDYKNVFILKAFTKMYAMAGIRLGYGLCSDLSFISKISNIGQPWSVSTVAEKAGLAALEETEFVDKTKSVIKENREYLLKELKKLGFTTYKSMINYILFKSPIIDLKTKTERYGILIRSCSNYRNLDDSFYRIAVKSRESSERFINALKMIVKEENK
ncbi:L-threonine O-3-phosphate decarboxylase [Clostridium sp. DSM 8431]|uniref:pyridoxal phosphate-dependent aminotransferase n=1 Tax=Clostridium sp. DSM 8431 TaxID=1761781 RepID=UPI0008EF4D09|nr:histidinol-phosphate transaminase [Clostridium sp. DSM 8431]SFU42389.1 L-threonine O-3-phosphate decarboxylase [Clostridium sp. DSM 8431]